MVMVRSTEHSLSVLDGGEGTTPEWSGVEWMDRSEKFGMNGYLDHWMDDPDEAEAFVYLFQRQPSTLLNCFLIRTHVQRIHHGSISSNLSQMRPSPDNPLIIS